VSEVSFSSPRQACHPLVLIGLPGSGKSTIGKLLAKRLGYGFVDSDAVIESRLGCSIRQFFEIEGEARFRDVEQAVLGDLLSNTDVSTSIGKEANAQSSLVISTGGGIVLREANRQALSAQPCVVYLRASAAELYKRLRHDKVRPLLQVSDPLKKITELYEQREPLYRECAHFVIETGRPSVHALVNMIISQLELAGLLVSPSTTTQP
jgi:shikimate kinase